MIGSCKLLSAFVARRGTSWFAGILAMAAVAAIVAAFSWGALPAVAQEDPLSLADFDRSGLEVEALALFEAGGATTLYSAADSRWGAAGLLVEGDVDIDENTRIVRVMLPQGDGSLLRLNDDGGVVMRRYFGLSGGGEDLTVWVQTGSATASFPANDVRTVGNNYVNFNVPQTGRAVLSGIGSGDRFILALTRPAPAPEPTPEATPEPTPESTPEPTPEPTPESTTTPVVDLNAREPTPESTTTPVVDVDARELLWSHTMTVREINARYPVFYIGEAHGAYSVPASWQITLPDGSIARVVASLSLSLGSDGPFFWTVNSNGSALHEYALELEVGDRVLPIGDAIIVEGGLIGIPYSWPTGGRDWSEGDTVELKLYHYPNREALSPASMERPDRVSDVGLVATAAGELAVTWNPPANAISARVEEYLVYLRRADGQWSDALGKVYRTSEQSGNRLRVVFSGLEAGEEYEAKVYARNVAALGGFKVSGRLAAPERAPATLSAVSLTGTSEVDFVPEQSRYVVRVTPGVTEATLEAAPAEEGATVKVIGVRSDRGSAAVTSDADLDVDGEQIRISGNGDTLALVEVTSADDARQYVYGVIMGQEPGSQDDGEDGLSSLQSKGLSERGKGGPTARSARAPRIRAQIDTITVSYGGQTKVYSNPEQGVTLTVPHEVRHIGLAATEAHGGRVWAIVKGGLVSLPVSGVGLRGSYPGGPTYTTGMSIGALYVNADGYGTLDFVSVTVEREPPTQNDATLSSLEVSGATLAPSFLFDLADYTVSVGHASSTATIEAVANQSSATVAYVPTTAGGAADPYQRSLDVGDNLVTITVTAPDGVTIKEYTVTIDRPSPPSSVATLDSLVVAGATTSPAFSSSVESYSARVRSHVSLVTLDLAPSDGGATIRVNPPDANPGSDGWQIPVDSGANTVSITVTAENGTTTKNYMLTVNRNSPGMESASLGSLAVTGADIYPAFGEDVLSYTAIVGNDRAQVTVSAAGKHASSTVRLSASDADSAADGHQVDLAEGRNVFDITVTAMAGTTTKEYVLTVFRAPPVADTTGFLQVDAGWDNFCGVRVDHTLVCNNETNSNYGNLRDGTPSGVFEQVSVTRGTGCGLRKDGSRECWGELRYIKTYTKTGVKVDDFSRSAEYGGENCVLLENGDMSCLGVIVEGPFKAIAQNHFGACGLRSDDLVRCWAAQWTGWGQIDLPFQYRDTEFTFISGGYGQACGIRKSDSNVLCWWWVVAPPMGIPSNTGNEALWAPSGEYSFVDTGIYGRSCGVKSDGTVDCWKKDKMENWLSGLPGESDIGYVSATLNTNLLCGLRKDKEVRCRNLGGTVNTHFSAESPWRDNSQLLGVDLGGTPLYPAFDRDVLSYSASVPQDTAVVAVKPVLTNSLAVHAIYSDRTGAAGDDGLVTLEEGENIINIHVISADRTASSTYSITVDTTDAKVERVGVTSTSTGGVYGVGEVIEITVGFTNPVTATGTPGFKFGTDAGERTAAYASGSGTRSLVFRYTVVAGDRDADGIWIGHHGPRPGLPSDVGSSWSVDASNSLKAPDNSDANLDFSQRRVYEGHQIDTD